MTTIWLNGSFVEAGAARVAALDAGLQHGVGLFETMTGGAGTGGRGAWVHRLEDHLDRLIASARELGLSDRLRKPALAEVALAVAGRHAAPRCRLRLTITGGDLNLLSRGPGASGAGGAGLDPTILAVAQPVPPYPPQWFEQGIMATIAGYRLSPLDPSAGYKTLAYWPRLRELQAAAGAGGGESLVFSITNHLAGGCVSNAFLVKGGQLLTPIARGEEGGGSTKGTALPSPVLPGVTRLTVLEAATRLGLSGRRQMLTIQDVLRAEEVFLTNSSWGVLPVVAVEKEPIGPGRPGPVTLALREAWLAELDGSGMDPGSASGGVGA